VFSQRRAEILDRMEARTEHSPRAAQIAALDTRKAKAYDVDTNALRTDWAQRSHDAGFGVPDIADLLGRGTRREPQVWSVAALFDDLASATGVTQHASTFERRDVIRSACSAEIDGRSARARSTAGPVTPEVASTSSPTSGATVTRLSERCGRTPGPSSCHSWTTHPKSAA
jgi:hypothetical protein